MIQASAKTSALRHRHRNVESTWLQIVAVTECCLCHRHTRAILFLWHRYNSVSSSCSHSLRPFSPQIVLQSRIGGQKTTPHPLCSFVSQPCSFGSHCAGRVTRSVSISIISRHTPLGKLQGPCFGEPHAQTVEDLFPSSVVAAQTTTRG